MAGLKTILVRAGAGLASLGLTCLAAGEDARPSDRLAEPPGSAEVVFEGRPAPGSRIAIGPDGPAAPGSTYRWTQVEGPAVAIDDASAPKIRFQIPADARRLAFVLKIRDDQGERSIRVAVPVTTPLATGDEPSAARLGGLDPALPSTSLPVADPGDDQIGLVGRRITLNGGRSRPSGRVGFRWLQLSGPAISDPKPEGPYYSFVPREAGIYRFALLVGHESQVSEPKVVMVEVGQRPGAARGGAPVDGPQVVRWAASVVATIPQGAETGGEVADVFESIADRTPLYTSYGQLQSELARRIDVVLPADPATRAAWSSQVFGPLTQLTTAELLAAGVDLRSPAASDRPLDPAQKERIQTYFRGLAGAFRQRPSKS